MMVRGAADGYFFVNRALDIWERLRLRDHG